MKFSLRAITFLFIVCFTMTACLKDKDYDKGITQSVHNINTNESIIEMQLTSTNTDEFLFTALDGITHDTTINLLPVVLAGSQPAAEDINVTLAPKPSLIDDFNAANATAYTVPAASMYTPLNQNNVVTISKGSRVGYLKIKLKPSDFLGQDWAFAYTITSVDKPGYVISGNLKEGIFAFGIKNKYDGRYLMTGTMVDAAVPAITGPFPIEVNLETVGGNSVILNPAEGPFAGSYLYPILSNGSPSAYGSFTPVFLFDGNDNITEVINEYGQPAGNTRSAQIDPSGINKWFSTDRHIDVKFWMDQPSSIAGHRTSFDLKFTYLGGR